MPLRTSRRRAAQAALAGAAVVALRGSPVRARQATSGAGGEAAIGAAQVESAVARLDALIEDALDRTGVPGAAVAVVYRDEVIYERGFGVREIGKPGAITPETVFQIASLSKPISSTLVAAVVGDGATTWDATIASIEPGFALSDAWGGEQITLRDMFCHRSGLPAYAGDLLIDAFNCGHEECLRRLRHVPMATPPRTAFAYTNLGLSAAAYAAARAAGQSWEDLAEERLFARLGMTSASYRSEDYVNRTNRAEPHYRTRDGAWVLGEVTDDDAAASAGGVSSNLRDLTAWLRLQLGGGSFAEQEGVASAPLHETHRPQSLVGSPPDPAAGPASFYGLGWFAQYDDRGQLEVLYGGDFSSGFITRCSLLPAAGLGMVVLTNGWPSAPRGAIPRAFLEMVTHGEPSRDWVDTIETGTAAALAGLAASSAFSHSGPPAGATSPLPLDAYVGMYSNALYGHVTVREEDGGLTLKFGSNPNRRALRHWDRDTFRYSPAGSVEVLFGQLGVVFTSGADGAAQAALVSLEGFGPDTAATFTRVLAGA